MIKQSFSYNKEWTNKIVDSSEFKKQDENQNPNYMSYESERYISASLKLEAFNLSSSFNDKLDVSENLLSLEPTVNLLEGYSINGKYIINSINVDEPVVGDDRVSFTFYKYDVASILGKQSENEIKKYTTKKRSAISKLSNGEKTADEMINDY